MKNLKESFACECNRNRKAYFAYLMQGNEALTRIILQGKIEGTNPRGRQKLMWV